MWYQDILNNDKDDTSILADLMYKKVANEITTLLSAIQNKANKIHKNQDKNEQNNKDKNGKNNHNKINTRLKRNIIGNMLNMLTEVATEEQLKEQLTMEEKLRTQVLHALAQQTSYEQQTIQRMINISNEEDQLLALLMEA